MFLNLQMVERLLDPEGEFLEYFENTLSILGYMSYVASRCLGSTVSSAPSWHRVVRACY